MRRLTLTLVLALVAFGCDGFDAPISDTADIEGDPASAFAKAGTQADEDFSHITAMVDRVNAALEAEGSELRLDYPWLFRVGLGTDPWGRLRTGSRWPANDVRYVLDESDYTQDVDAVVVDATLQRSYETWNEVSSSNLRASRIPDSGENFDILDGIIRVNGACFDIVDVNASNLVAYNPFTGLLLFDPEADIVVGGWIQPEYFSDCLGSAAILGVTWSFSIPDQDGDNYRDRVYVEQFYNTAFAWTTTDAAYLDFNAPVDIESVALHENGHAHGLGHFGGPVRNAPFQLKPNLKVFTPEAVMNPGYLGGKQRDLLPTDVAGMRTLYASNGR